MTETSLSEPRFQRPVPASLSLETKLKLEALATMLQQPTSAVLERAILTYISSLPEPDRALVQSLATRARQSLSLQSESGNGGMRTSETVTGKEFRFRGSLEDGLEILFENSQPLRITSENIQRIKEEIENRKGRALMGAIYSPLMPNSIGEAIQKKHRLTPINLSYVIPLLIERNLVRAFKEGRNWYVEAVQNAPRTHSPNRR
jgi:hypothetical protein